MLELRNVCKRFSGIAAVDDIRLANRRSAEVRMKPQPTEAGDKFARYTILGPTTQFLRDNGVKFAEKWGEGFETGLDGDSVNHLATLVRPAHRFLPTIPIR